MAMSKLQQQLKKKEKERKAAARRGTPASSESRAKAAADAQTYICQVCRQALASTNKAPQLVAHAEARHPRVSPETCFPQLEEMGKE